MPSRDNTGPTSDAVSLLRPTRRDMLRYLGIGGAAGLAGCGGDGGDGTTTTPEPTTTTPADRSVNGTFTEAFSSAATTVNWLYNTEDSTSERIYATLDGAWAVDNKGSTGTLDDEVFPLWLDVESEDNQTYTLTVQDGLEWGGDYGQMTAEDWVYMLNNVMLADENWSGYPNYTGFTGEVSKTGDMTFEYTLPSPDVAWQFRPAGGGGFWGMECVPKGLLQQYVEMWQDGSPDQAAEGLEQDEELNNLEYTGNLGPYTIKSWEQDDQFVAERNEDYYMHDRDGVSDAWQGAPYYTEIVQRVVPEQASRLSALSEGEIDRAALPPDRVQEYENSENTNVYAIDDPYIRQVTFNMRANGWAPFREKAVRQAVMTAMNKETFVQDVFRGYGAPAHTMQPNWSSWYDDSQVTRFGVGDSFGTDQARTQLADALSNSDYEHSVDGETVVDGDGNQVNLTLVAQSGQPTEQTMAELIKQYLDQVGFQVNITTVQGLPFVRNYAYNTVPEDQADQVPDDWPTGDPTAPGFNSGPRDLATSNKAWDLALIYRFNTYPRTPSDSKAFFFARGGINYYGYVPSEGVDIKAMYEEAAQASDPDTRQELFAEVFGVISEEQPFGILMSEKDTQGYRSDIAGPSEGYGQGWDSTTWFRTS